MTDGSDITAIGANARAKLKSFVERVERLHAEQKELSADVAEVHAEVKAEGLDSRILRQVVRLRAKDPAKRLEEEALVELYETALRG